MTDATKNGSYQLTDHQRMNLNTLALQADLREKV